MNAEQKLVQVLQQNEHVVQIVSFDELQKEWEAKKPGVKTAAGLVAPVKDSVVATKLIKELGIKTDKVIIKSYAGKKYVIFKGPSGVREIFRGTRYLANNPKVVRMAVGPKGVANAVKGGFILTVVLSVGIEVFDYFIRDTSTLSHLLGEITGDIIKIGVSSIAAVVAGLAVGSMAVIGSVAAVPIIAAIAVGVLTGLILDSIDSKLGATAALIKAYKTLGIELREIKYEATRWHSYFNSNPRALMHLFGSSGGYYFSGY